MYPELPFWKGLLYYPPQGSPNDTILLDHLARCYVAGEIRQGNE